jgi:trehalose 6-phosphate phosphatase
VTPAATLDEALAPLLADPAQAAVLLDVDGTLAPIVRHADDAHVPEPTRLPLIAIAKRYGLVACITGRQATTARRIVSLGSITYVGNHGTEMLRGGQTEPEIEPEIAAWASRVQKFAATELRADALHRLRVRGEDKNIIYGFHWRGAPDEAAAEAAVREIEQRALAAGFHTHVGRKILEVRPPLDLHKGKGVDRLLQGSHVRVALYAGDDLTDLDAFTALRAAVADGRLASAICVGVQSDETPPEIAEAADVLVDGPLGVRALLELLAA